MTHAHGASDPDEWWGSGLIDHLGAKRGGADDADPEDEPEDLDEDLDDEDDDEDLDDDDLLDELDDDDLADLDEEYDGEEEDRPPREGGAEPD